MEYERPVLLRATFDPKLRIYHVLNSTAILAVTIVGIPLIPLWIPFGIWWSRRYFATLSCELTDRTIAVRRGVVYRRETTIPLDKIQDVSLRDGPLLRLFALTTLRIETAGQNTTSSGLPEADLTGVVGAREFRDAVLRQRDALASPSASTSMALPSAEVLVEIRDLLARIERNTSQHLPVAAKPPVG